jgi:competence protein ComEA
MKFKAIRELFHFTQKERNGIIALFSLIFILIAINIFLPYFIKNKTVDTSKWKNEVDKYLSRQDQEEQSAKLIEVVPFDPNNVTANELTQFGLPAKVAANWIRYIEKGGRFKKKEDVKRIYGMTIVVFDKIERYILFPKATKIPDGAKTTSGIRNVVNQRRDSLITDHRSLITNRIIKRFEAIELNKADSLELVKLPGIGPILASRIIRYRNLLGGYYAVDQLHEVYGLREEHFTSASPYLTLDAEHFRRFNINFASLHELGKHPYIGFKTARKIVKLRDERGKYSSIDDLSGLMTIDSLQRLTPYLIFDQ